MEKEFATRGPKYRKEQHIIETPKPRRDDSRAWAEHEQDDSWYNQLPCQRLIAKALWNSGAPAVSVEVFVHFIVLDTNWRLSVADPGIREWIELNFSTCFAFCVLSNLLSMSSNAIARSAPLSVCKTKYLTSEHGEDRSWLQARKTSQLTYKNVTGIGIQTCWFSNSLHAPE